MLLSRYVLVFGLVYIAFGIFGFLPIAKTPAPMDFPELTLNQSYGLLFGLFVVNTITNILHIALGAWALIIGQNQKAMRIFTLISAAILTALTLFGFLPGADTLWGIAPLFGHVIWIHGLSAVAAWYVIYQSTRQSQKQDVYGSKKTMVHG